MKSSRTRIEFDYNGKHYRLEYTANSLKKLEQRGVNFSKLDTMIFTAQELLFKGAFFANHPSESEKTMHDIYLALKRTATDVEPEYDDEGREIDYLSQTLATMLSEAVDELTGRGDKGNVSWKVT